MTYRANVDKVLLGRHSQHGAALVVSMILLIVLTILVLGSLRGAAINSKMATNVQLNTSFKTPVEGEVYAQMHAFSNGGNGVDMLISEAIKANGGAFTLMPKINNRFFKEQALTTSPLVGGTDPNATPRNCENIASQGGAYVLNNNSTLTLVSGYNDQRTKTGKNTPQPGDPQDAIKNVYDCLSVSLHDLTKKASNVAVMPWKSDRFIHGRLCEGYGQTVGCQNMVLNVNAEASKLGQTSQTVGFGVVAPSRKGVQGIKNES